MRALLVLALLGLTALSGCLDGDDPAESTQSLDANAVPGSDDVVVIAVVDSGFNPYHYDFLADRMPQHGDLDRSDDLPLDRDPATWLPGHPGAAGFASYEALPITLPTSDQDKAQALHDTDAEAWGRVQQSTGSSDADVHMRWIPGTKVVGYVDFGNDDGFAPASHGVGTSSVSVGNLHGTCPHCLLVFVNGLGEQASEWVAQQDWIDAQTNSWGKSFGSRDRLYAGSDTELQREAVERGQSIFFSAGNGQGNAFVAPNPTLFSSQEGPDWIVTVGAVTPNDGGSYTGHGKPADVASVGSGYPAASGNDGTVTAEGTFGGTSNATPVTAGLYGEALYQLRRKMAGASRIQQDGVVSVGELPCGADAPDCATADGQLTVDELRRAFFLAPTSTEAGWNVGGYATAPAETAEMRFLAEGHGVFWGRLQGDEQYQAEVGRIVALADGTLVEEQDADEEAWFVADSHCRQAAWGSWDHGYDDGTRPVPAADPEWPARTWLVEQCPVVVPAVIEAVRTVEPYKPI